MPEERARVVPFKQGPMALLGPERKERGTIPEPNCDAALAALRAAG